MKGRIYRRAVGQASYVTVGDVVVVKREEKRPRGGSPKFIEIYTTYRESREFRLTLECGHSILEQKSTREDGRYWCSVCQDGDDAQSS